MATLIYLHHSPAIQFITLFNVISSEGQAITLMINGLFTNDCIIDPWVNAL